MNLIKQEAKSCHEEWLQNLVDGVFSSKPCQKHEEYAAKIYKMAK